MAKDIQNFGEHIGGSRADLWKGRGILVSDLSEMNDAEEEKYVTRDNIWKREDARKAVAGGKSAGLAFYQNSMRTSLLPKPWIPSSYDGEKRRQAYQDYVKTVALVRDAVMGATEPGRAKDPETGEDISAFTLIKKYCCRVNDLSGQYMVAENARGAVDNKVFRMSQHSVSFFEHKAERQNYGKTKEEVIAETAAERYGIAKYVGKVEDKWKTERGTAYATDETRDGYVGYHHEFGYGNLYMDKDSVQPRSEWADGTYLVVNWDTARVIQANLSEEAAQSLVKAFVDIDKQMAMKKVAEKNQKAAEHRRPRYVPEQLEHIRRTGADDYTKGREMTGEDYLSTFHFRGGEFGNWLTQNDRQENLNMAFNAFHDLAKALHVEPEDVSLGGELAIAFGARGQGSALAHYEPARNVINLTKMRGAGSLAHEWGHALDQYISAQMGEKRGKLASEGIHARSVRTTALNGTNIPESFERLVNALHYKEVPYPKEEGQRDRMAVIERMHNQIEGYVDETQIPDELRNKWYSAVLSAVNHPSTVVEYNANGKEDPYIDRLSELKEEITGEPLTQVQVLNILSTGAELLRATKRVEDEMNRTRTVQTDFAKASEKYDTSFSKEDKGYWSSNCEMLARAFACYVNDKLREMGIRSDYLCGHSEMRGIEIDGTRYCAIPQGEERKAINEAFDAVFAELKEKGILHERTKEPELKAEKEQEKIVTSAVPDSLAFGRQMTLFELFGEQERTR